LAYWAAKGERFCTKRRNHLFLGQSSSTRSMIVDKGIQRDEAMS
jgi:hypothetical protein